LVAGSFATSTFDINAVTSILGSAPLVIGVTPFTLPRLRFIAIHPGFRLSFCPKAGDIFDVTVRNPFRADLPFRPNLHGLGSKNDPSASFRHHLSSPKRFPVFGFM
jgi:hypothetical protein